ncbi:D-isomer specific 2-hydroxyacid dehydrogenase family protein [Vibrio sp. IRLE0018]|uniref:NAD(P)-dependent oxidoreductase n=1 Tax=Vibrio floridensis TaxID=2908007 RepID=UPI001F256F45|nr:D-isomer specific 2-hydroxyacid dehydrogenase family protein [Vibrio floridensis]MCF8780317.1 D-isomer specific 2-hydroxyacid dehydrogenase family protein [Vibrio floridensis]
MNKMKPLIINLEPEGYSLKAASRLGEYFDYREVQNGKILPEQLKEASGIITRLAYQINHDFLGDVEKLKFVATATTGINHIDETLGLDIVSLKGERAFLNKITPTAEHTWGLLLALARQYKKAFKSVEQFVWNRDEHLGIQLYGKTIGIIGLGRLGRMVAQYAKAFGMRVVYHDNQAVNSEFESVSLDTLLQQSDVVSIHLPLESDTVEFISYKELSMMKPGALLINTARGEILNEDALLDALLSGRLAGAALDVVSEEKAWGGIVPAENRLVQYACNHHNLLITPHIGGACPDAMRMTEEFIAEKIIQHYAQLS